VSAPADGGSPAPTCSATRGAVEQASEHAGRGGDQRRRPAAEGRGRCRRPERFRAPAGTRRAGDRRRAAWSSSAASGLLTGHGMNAPAGLAAQCRSWEREGRTAVLIGWDGAVQGAVAVADNREAVRGRPPVARLRRAWAWRPVLLTGDNEGDRQGPSPRRSASTR